jgi:hypothetical protein
MSELQEVAASMWRWRGRALPFASSDEARAFVRQLMRDESPQVIDGVAWELMRLQRAA